MKQMQPLYWRLSDFQRGGLSAVSLLIPTSLNAQTVLELPMSVCCAHSASAPQDLIWSSEDVELFFLLLERLLQTQLEGNIELDMHDHSVQAIMQLVAKMRFQQAKDMQGLEGSEIQTVRSHLRIGDLVAINSCMGFVSAIVVALEEETARCVVFEALELRDKTIVAAQSLVRVKRIALLPAAFAEDDQGEHYTRH